MKKSLITLLLLALLGAAAFFAFPPLSMYMAEIETSMSSSLGRPVKIGRMSVSVYPHPGILLTDVVIDGAPRAESAAGGAYAGNAASPSLHISKIWLEPDVRTLFEPRKALRRVFVSGLVLTPEVLAELPAIVRQANGSHSNFQINGLYFERFTLTLPKLSIADLQGSADLAGAAGLNTLNLHTDDRSLRLALTPVGQRIDFEVEGFAIHIPALAPMAFNSINVKGALENGDLNVSAFDFRLFDGAIKGAANVKLEPNIAVKGDLTFDHVDSKKLSSALGVENLLTGDLEGKASFSGDADEWKDILPAQTADGSFLIQRGSLNGVDLAEAARRISEQPVRGGTMSFEQFSGKMRLAAAKLRFYGMVMESGLMSSVGSADVAPDQSLNGRMDLQIRGSANQMHIPIVLGGTLQAPTARAVRPQRNSAAVVASQAPQAAQGAGANNPAARAGAQRKERDADNASASRDSGENVILPSVQSARF